MGELGDLLRSTREAKGISLEHAEEETRVRRQYLEALEAEDFEQMPAEVYVRGFLRNYALYLGLDPEKTLALRGTPSEEAVAVSFSKQLEEPLISASPLLLLPKILGVFIILGVLVAAGWWGYQWYTENSPFASPTATPTLTSTPTALATVVVIPPEPSPTAEPTMQPTATFTATPSPPTPTLEPTATPFIGVRVSVEVIETTWLEVTVDGEEVLRESLEPGVSLSWTGLEKVSFHCGNAGGVMVTVNGEEIGVLGELGEVVDLEWVAP